MNYDGPFVDSDTRWWTKPRGENIHESVFSLVSQIETETQPRINSIIEWRAMYEDRRRVGEYRKTRVTFNVARSCTDTAASKIAKHRPRPEFLTTRGDYDAQERAKGLTAYVDGVFDEMDVYRHGQLVFRDACVGDGGALKVFIKGDRIACERVLPRELFVDQTDGQYGKPRQIHHRRRVHRETLAGMFPEKRGYIMTAPQATSYNDPLFKETITSNSMIWVIESWHLPSGKGADDGRHVISIENADLLDEGWSKTYFPFVFFFWQEPLEGFWSAGLVEEVAGIQDEINRLLDDIRCAQTRFGRPYVALERGADIDKDEINNEIGTIVRFTGTPPVFGMTNAMPDEIYAHLERLYQKAYEITGVSQMSAQAQKPAGLDSGKALREYSDIESERFALCGQRWERFYMDVAKMVVDLSRDLFSEDVDMEVNSKAAKWVRRIKWSEVDLDDDRFVMRVYATGILPSTPSGRYDQIVDMAQNQLITPDQAKQLLDLPDVEDETSLDLANRNAVRKIIDDMLRGEPYEPPEPFYNLELAKSLAVKAYLRAKVEGAKEDDLAKVRQFILAVDTMAAAATAPDPRDMMAQMAGQMGGGMQTPGGIASPIQGFPQQPPMPQMPLDGMGGQMPVA